MGADLTIVIVNWNTRDHLANCLQSISDTIRGDEELLLEVWVIDNDSHDGSAAMVREWFPWVHLVENAANLGFVYANNQAIKRSESAFVLLLNSDAILTENAAQALIEVLERNPLAGAAGPMLLNPDGSFQASHNRFPTFLSSMASLLGLAKRFYGEYFPSAGPEDNEEQAVDWVGGACMMVRGTAIREIGLLDENIVMYAEEMDWCYRMLAAGYRVIYCPAARVIHVGGASSSSVEPYILARLWQSRLYFIGKHQGSASARLLRACVFFFGLLRSGLFGLMALFEGGSRGHLSARAKANYNLAMLRTGY